MRLWTAAALAFAVALAPLRAAATLPPSPAAAASPALPTVIYRCSTSAGAVSLQDEPCGPGQREERREVASFAPPPVTAVQDADATPSPNADTNNAIDPLISPRIEAAQAPPPRPLLMPPPLWRCADLNGVTRLVDRYDPQPRCVPLAMLGVDLSRAPPSAATLCRTVEDSCVELGGDAACAAWQEHLDAAESALRTAFSDTMVERREARDRAKAVIDNDCRP